MARFDAPLCDADGRPDLKAMSRAELTAWMARTLGLDDGAATRVFRALWRSGVSDLRRLPDVRAGIREGLATHGHASVLTPALVLRSDDGTVKFLWELVGGHTIESVLIPDGDRLTLCVSSQVGCAMACAFCLTGDLGLARHLSAAEIAGQVLQVQQLLDEDERITNVVLMGMGEPLHNLEQVIAALEILLDGEGMNLSHRRITVSTVGLVPQLKELARRVPVNLAISLHATAEAARRELMPISRKHDMAELLDACRGLGLPSGKRIQFEYLMVAGVNDTLADADRLAALLADVPAKVNLIPYNENPDRDLGRPEDTVIEAFRDRVRDHGVTCTVRISRGLDVSAACGQLGKAWAQATDQGWLAQARALAGLPEGGSLRVDRGGEHLPRGVG